MTVGIATRVGDFYFLLADSRVTSDTYKHNDTRKLHVLGEITVIGAGDMAQVQRILRTAGEDESESVDGFVAHLEDVGADQCEWIVQDSEGIYHICPGSGTAVVAEQIPDDDVAIIGSGGPYVRGYLDAFDHPETIEQAKVLYRNALHSCSKRYMCVGGPYRCRIIKIR